MMTLDRHGGRPASRGWMSPFRLAFILACLMITLFGSVTVLLAKLNPDAAAMKAASNDRRRVDLTEARELADQFVAAVKSGDVEVLESLWPEKDVLQRLCDEHHVRTQDREAILSRPTELQDTKLASMARLQAAWKMDVGRQKASLAHYRSKCGEDIASYLYEFNMCRDQNQIFEAVPAATFLSRIFPGDPEVNEILKFGSQVLRGN